MPSEPRQLFSERSNWFSIPIALYDFMTLWQRSLSWSLASKHDKMTSISQPSSPMKPFQRCSQPPSRKERLAAAWRNETALHDSDSTRLVVQNHISPHTKPKPPNEGRRSADLSWCKPQRQLCCFVVKWQPLRCASKLSKISLALESLMKTSNLQKTCENSPVFENSAKPEHTNSV